MRSLLLLLLVAASGWLYADRLAYAPPNLEIDEVLIGLDAHSIATTGRDLRGEVLPLYSQTAEHSWYQPFVIYLSALTLKFVPLSEWSIRLPTLFVGIVDIALMYVLARSLFGSDVLAAVAAAFLALTPAHFIHSRFGMDYVYPVPFVLGWLLCLSVYDKRRSAAPVVIAAGLLGIGFYSYISSMLMMPLYFGVTALFLSQKQAPRRLYWYAAAAFLIPLVPFLVWFARHPAAYAATVEKYGLYDASQFNAVQGLRSALSYLSISQRVSMYWRFLNPSVLFFNGGAKVMFSTGLVGVFLLPLGIFLPVGLYQALKHRAVSINLVLALGFLTAPLPALIVAEDDAVFRALALLPFGVLLATLGVAYLWSAPIVTPLRRIYQPIGAIALVAGAAYAAWTLVTQHTLTRSSVPLIVLGAGILLVGSIVDRTKQWRIVVVLLLALIPLQFQSFRSDYFTDYRVRSSVWLGGNIRGALEDIIDRDQRERVPQVYFSTLKATGGLVDTRNQYMDAYWTFYLIKHRREDLRARTLPLDPEHVQLAPSGSLVLANLGDTTTEALVNRGDLKRVTTIPELDRSQFFVVLRR